MEAIGEEESQGEPVIPASENASSQFERDREGIERERIIKQPGIPEVQALGASLTNSQTRKPKDTASKTIATSQFKAQKTVAPADNLAEEVKEEEKPKLLSPHW